MKNENGDRSSFFCMFLFGEGSCSDEESEEDRGLEFHVQPSGAPARETIFWPE